MVAIAFQLHSTEIAHYSADQNHPRERWPSTHAASVKEHASTSLISTLSRLVECIEASRMACSLPPWRYAEATQPKRNHLKPLVPVLRLYQRTILCPRGCLLDGIVVAGEKALAAYPVPLLPGWLLCARLGTDQDISAKLCSIDGTLADHSRRDHPVHSRGTYPFAAIGRALSPYQHLEKRMQIQINTDHHIAGHEALAAHVRSIVEHALSHLTDHLTRVEVHLSDENGPAKSHKTGQSDKRCLLEARLANYQPLAVTAHAATVHQSVDAAADKLARMIESTLGRLHDHKHRHDAETPSEEAPPELP